MQTVPRGHRQTRALPDIPDVVDGMVALDLEDADEVSFREDELPSPGAARGGRVVVVLRVREHGQTLLHGTLAAVAHGVRPGFVVAYLARCQAHHGLLGGPGRAHVAAVRKWRIVGSGIVRVARACVCACV